jgi:hypothetical protein
MLLCPFPIVFDKLILGLGSPTWILLDFIRTTTLQIKVVTVGLIFFNHSFPQMAALKRYLAREQQSLL